MSEQEKKSMEIPYNYNIYVDLLNCKLTLEFVGPWPEVSRKHVWDMIVSKSLFRYAEKWLHWPTQTEPTYTFTWPRKVLDIPGDM